MKMLVEAYREGLFQRKHWLQNIISGIVVGVVAIPLAMAFAIASGASPEQGLYTAIVAGIFVSLFGGSKLQIAGPTGAFIVILSGITAKYGFEGLQVATMMAGVMLAVMGLLRLGTVIKFIPYPVIIGFTAGIAVVIWVGQWQYFFGLEGPIGSHFHEKLWNLVLSLPKLDVATSLVALISLIVVIFAPKIRYLKKIPAPFLALVVATFTVNIFDLNGVATIGSAFGGIPLGLPSFHLPDLSYARIMELIRPAFAIAILGAIESLLSAVIADGMAGTKHNSNQELIGQGLANIAAPLFGGIAATGAIARTSTNVKSGGRTPIARIIHAITLLGIVLIAAPLASYVPLAALSAIVMVVAINMGEWHEFKELSRYSYNYRIILLATFFVTVLFDL